MVICYLFARLLEMIRNISVSWILIAKNSGAESVSKPSH